MWRRILAAFLLALLPTAARAGDLLGGKLSVGSGVPYGTPLIGLGGQIDLGPYVSVLGGVGAGTYRSPWSVGARIHFVPLDSKWRPHLTGVRWTEGYGVYAGVDHDIGKPGGFVMTYGIGYGNVNPEAKVGTMIGIGYRF